MDSRDSEKMSDSQGKEGAESNSGERRSGIRQIVIGSMLISVDIGAGNAFGLLVNLSEHDAAIQSLQPLEVGARNRLRWTLPGDDTLIEAIGETVWSRNNLNGVRFLDLSQSSRARITNWLLDLQKNLEASPDAASFNALETCKFDALDSSQLDTRKVDPLSNPDSDVLHPRRPGAEILTADARVASSELEEMIETAQTSLSSQLTEIDKDSILQEIQQRSNEYLDAEEEQLSLSFPENKNTYLSPLPEAQPVAQLDLPTQSGVSQPDIALDSVAEHFSSKVSGIPAFRHPVFRLRLELERLVQSKWKLVLDIGLPHLIPISVVIVLVGAFAAWSFFIPLTWRFIHRTSSAQIAQPSISAMSANQAGKTVSRAGHELSPVPQSEAAQSQAVVDPLSGRQAAYGSSQKGSAALRALAAVHKRATAPKSISAPRALYSAAAPPVHRASSVELVVAISAAGEVMNVRVVRVDPVLSTISKQKTTAAVNAAKLWHFQPCSQPAGCEQLLKFTDYGDTSMLQLISHDVAPKEPSSTQSAPVTSY
jgi:hypothetical protein